VFAWWGGSNTAIEEALYLSHIAGQGPAMHTDDSERSADEVRPARCLQEANMRNSSQCPHRGTAKRCAFCGGQFGLIRYYYWRSALCSKKCVDRFKVRRKADRNWLFRWRTV
jgi:hypothetical protein